MPTSARFYLSSFTAIAVTLMAVATTSADQSVHADRSPLTFRDAGLYCNVNMIHGTNPEDEGLINMLSADRAGSPETPWAFYVMQCNYNSAEEDPDSLQPQVLSLIRRMAANGKKVILRVHIGRLHANPNVDEMEQWIVTLFEHIDPNWLYAITLGEEQVFWNGWADALTKLYYRVKARWPDLPVYQWWTPPVAIDVRATGGWMALPADGWLIDLYGLRKQVFERKLVKFLEAGKPVVHIAWASPTWLNPTLSGTEADTWVPEGQAILDEQLDVCRAYNVPVGYFCTQPEGTAEEKALGNNRYIRWGWHAKDPVVRSFFRELETRVLNLKHLHEDSIGYRKIHPRLFNWARAPLAPVGITYAIDEQNRKQASILCDISLANPTAGTHQIPMPIARPILTAQCILDDSAQDLEEGLRIRSIKGRSVSVPIVIRVESKRPVAFQTITANLSTNSDLGGSAKLAWSSDGKTWSTPVERGSDQTNPKLSVSLPPTDLTNHILWLRIELLASAGVRTSVCSSLQSLRVTAAFEPAL